MCYSAIALLELGQLQQAQQAAETACELDASSCFSHFARAEALRQGADRTKAAYSYQVAMQCDSCPEERRVFVLERMKSLMEPPQQAQQQAQQQQAQQQQGQQQQQQGQGQPYAASSYAPREPGQQLSPRKQQPNPYAMQGAQRSLLEQEANPPPVGPTAGQPLRPEPSAVPLPRSALAPRHVGPAEEWRAKAAAKPRWVQLYDEACALMPQRQFRAALPLFEKAARDGELLLQEVSRVSLAPASESEKAALQSCWAGVATWCVLLLVLLFSLLFVLLFASPLQLLCFQLRCCSRRGVPLLTLSIISPRAAIPSWATGRRRSGPRSARSSYPSAARR